MYTGNRMLATIAPLHVVQDRETVVRTQVLASLDDVQREDVVPEGSIH